MTERDCARLREVGAELALGVLPGRDRALATEHLKDCPACERYVGQLATISDRLTGLVPGVEPPVGFEQRVLRRMGQPARKRWPWLVTGFVALAIGFAGVGWVLHGILHPEELTSSSVSSAGRAVGEVFVYADSHPWLYVELSALGVNGTMSCQVRLDDGTAVMVGSFPVVGGSGQWAGPAPVADGHLVEVRILGPDGLVVGTALFG